MATYPIPDWQVILDGHDLTMRMRPRLLDLTLTEASGGEADQLDLRIHDHDGRVALPRRGVDLRVALGWAGSGLIDKGTFRVDEVEHSGAPDIITIRARSADLAKPMRTRRDRSFHGATVGDVVSRLASDHGLDVRIAPALASRAIAHIDQTNESDVALLTRLAQRHDAVATVKAGTLVFAPIGSGMTASGAPLRTMEIRRADGDQHRYALADRDNYDGVEAQHTRKGEADRATVRAGSGKNPKRLKQVYNTEAEAREQAEAENKRIKRGAATLGYTLALGRADLYPEQRVRVRGFKAEIDAVTWLIAKATHTISGSAGFTTQLELETAD